MPATKKPKRERQHDNVQHGMFLCDVNREPNGRLSRFAGLKCHRAHRFSRREQWQRYRNLIKAARRRLDADCEFNLRRLAPGLQISASFPEMHAYEIPISPPLASSRFQMAIWPFWVRLQCQPRQQRDNAMSLLSEPKPPLNSAIGFAMPVASPPNSCPTSSAQTCRRFPSAGQNARPPASNG